MILALAVCAIPAWGADDFEYIAAEFLFQSGDTAYFRCEQSIGAYDSVAADGYGELIDVEPPLWMIRTLPEHDIPGMGAKLYFQHIARPRAAAKLDLVCASDPWDPLRLSGVSGWVAGRLVHRTLFDLDVTSPAGVALVESYTWRGRDLVITLDTSVQLGDGTPVNAYTVKASLERYLWYRRNTPEYGWDRTIAGVEAYREGRMDHVVGLIPRSADTLQFNLLRPCYSLPERLSALSTAIVGWTVSGSESPVTAAAGYYGLRAGQVLRGVGEHGGELTLVLEPAVDRVVFGEQEHEAAGVRGLMMPELVIVRSGTDVVPELLTFLNYALDRSAVASIACGGQARFPSGLFPEPLVPVGGGGVDMDEAVAARGLIAGKPTVRLAAGDGCERVAEYLVTALKAWEFEAVYVPRGESFDLRVERWTFDSFGTDALVEDVLHHLGYASSDTLVTRLWAARSQEDDNLRRSSYTSLRSRLVDSAPYIVIYQRMGDYLFDAARYDATVTRWGGPLGPIFDREGVR